MITLRARRAAMAAALAALAAALPAQAAPWHRHYARALQMLEAGDAAGAEAELRRALQRRPSSSCSARTVGVRFREYLPHYQLGVALQRQGRTTEAAVELSLELAQDVIGRCPGARAAHADLQRRLAGMAIAAAAAQETVVASASEDPAPRPPAADLSATAAPAAGSAPAAPPEPQAVSVGSDPAPAAAPRRLRVSVPPLLGVAWSPALGVPPALLPPRTP